MNDGKLWSIVLAAGDGTRLSSLTTTPSGLRVPKQFCSLRGGASLLEESVVRAETVVPRRRILTVVAQSHRRWWEGALLSLPARNLIVQPQNKGTAAGLLLPLLHIVLRDPRATVLILPADHFVQDEARLGRSLQRATRYAAEDRRHAYLLGLAAHRPDPELGYIVPGLRKAGEVAQVKRFVEKPAAEEAQSLLGMGALLNMFIIAASARALLRLYATRHPRLVADLAAAVERDREGPQDGAAAELLYPALPCLDFSRHLLEGQEPWLRVLSVPDCGWSDLGTPRRVAEALARVGSGAASDEPGNAYLNLAEQQARHPPTLLHRGQA